jgi:hypothetical protein
MSTFLPEYIDGGPGCIRDDCEIIDRGGMSTLIHYPQVFDKQGNNINPDKNITTVIKKCKSCGKTWNESYENGIKVNFTE